MIWYRNGTVSVTNGNNVVTGVLTAWLSQAKPGDPFNGPDGRRYEVVTVPTDTSLTIFPPYIGSTASGQSYSIERGTAWNSTSDLSVTMAETAEAFKRGFSTISSTPITIGAGTHVFTVASGLPILPGARLMFQSRAGAVAGTHWINGRVTAYEGQALTIVAETWANASVTRADWDVNVSGVRGPIGAEVSVPVSTTINNLVGWDAANGGALKDLGSFASLLAIHGREVLTAHRTYYVRTNGNDANTGLANTAGGAFATLQRALDVVSRLDFNGYIVTIQLADGTYTASGALPICVGQTRTENLVIKGNAATPGNVILSVTSASCISATVPGAGARITDLELRTTTTGSGLNAENGASLEWGNIRFGACASSHIITSRGGKLRAIGNYEIVGGALCHFQGDGAGGQIECSSRSITLTGTPNFSVAFANAATNAVIRAFFNTYSGAATGPRYSATTGGGIQTFGGGANAFPGSSAGVATSPGWYS